MQKSKEKQSKRVKIMTLSLTTFSITLLILLSLLSLSKNMIYPNISIANVNVGLLNKQEAIKKVSSELKSPESITISIQTQAETRQFELAPESINFSLDIAESVSLAHSLTRSSSTLQNLKTTINTLINPTIINPQITYDNNLLDEQLAVLASFTTTPQYPEFILSNNEIELNKGKGGEVLDKKETKSKILQAFTYSQPTIIELKTQAIDPTLPEDKLNEALIRMENLTDKSITFSLGVEKMTLEDEQIIPLLNPNGGYNTDNISILLSTIANTFDQEPQNPIFEETDGRVREFSPAIVGVKTDKEALNKKLLNLLSEIESLESTSEVLAEIPATITQPQIKTQDLNNLGIKELIGSGSSRFVGSNASRVHNINLAASRLNGLLIKPGEVFSFNNALGDISRFTGFKESFIIQNGKTVLGDGGGVCQVSTTLFRAALNSGLEIVERNPHSYRVSYYEQGAPPGLDATIYSPTIDLKVKNDTPAHILIRTIADTKNMTLDFEFYGTKDSRVVQIGKPQISNFSQPPEPQYIDEPTLPLGVTQQIDFAAPGAKTTVKYTVEKDGKLLHEDTFISNYRPWQARYLLGISPTN